MNRHRAAQTIAEEMCTVATKMDAYASRNLDTPPQLRAEYAALDRELADLEEWTAHQQRGIANRRIKTGHDPLFN